MADDSNAPSASTATATGRSPSISGANAPPGFGLRRSMTVDEGSAARRRPTLAGSSTETSFGNLRRRSSNFSDLSLTDARKNLESSADDLFNPGQARNTTAERSPYAAVPLVLALLPAIGGVFFQGGSAFLTDVILLALAAVFLHWSVTQPWDWYHAAQEIRVVKDEIMTESVFEPEDDAERSQSPSGGLEDVPEEDEKEDGEEAPKKAGPKTSSNERREGAERELYFHELLALAWCFIFPLLATWLLHAIRSQLSRPSEGLVNDYNLSIFIIAAEIRPVSHLIKLVQTRTLRLQRFVAEHPFEKSGYTQDQMQDITGRLLELEAHVAEAAVEQQAAKDDPDSSRTGIKEADLSRLVQSTVQPELDALNRAVRRYEKKLALLANQTDARLEYIDARLGDAVALAAVAAKNSNSQAGLIGWVVGKAVNIILFPVQAISAAVALPVRTVSNLFGSKSKAVPERSTKPARSGRVSSRPITSSRSVKK